MLEMNAEAASKKFLALTATIATVALQTRQFRKRLHEGGGTTYPKNIPVELLKYEPRIAAIRLAFTM